MSRHTKSIDRRYVEHCQRIILRILHEDFDSNQSDMSRSTGISQTTISDAVNAKPAKGIGLAIVLTLRDRTGLSVEELLGLRPPKAKKRMSAERRSAISVAADSALFDGALDVDVESAAGHPDAADSRLTAGEAYDLIMRARRRREEDERANLATPTTSSPVSEATTEDATPPSTPALRIVPKRAAVTAAAVTARAKQLVADARRNMKRAERGGDAVPENGEVPASKKDR